MKALLDKIILKVRILLRRFESIPEISEKRDLIEYYRKIFEPKVMVETGTFFGDTIEYFKNKFDRLISIELSEELAEKAVRRFENDKHIKIIQGDSGVILHSLLAGLNSPALFWLDGHYSSEFYYKEEFIRTAKGEKDTPIAEELEIILKSSVKAIILIDDARLFNGTNGYPTIKAIKRKVKLFKMDSNVFVKKDIIQIIPKSK